MSTIKYRKDIDGLRAIAVIAVIIFHLGYLPNGYLGVDIFFVISGFLITKILYKGLRTNSFCIKEFYIKRIRRIVPLTLLITLVALCVGCIVMLPADLDALCQSIIATNLFTNNLLEVSTSTQYWSIRNEYKPLLHTWSLGIEEQYYLLYPFLFLFFKNHSSYIGGTLALLGAISLYLFFVIDIDLYQFYLLPFRFFELAIGGLAAIIFRKKLWITSFSFLPLIGLVFLLSLNSELINNEWGVLLAVVLTALLLLSNNEVNVNRFLLTASPVVFLGKLSFSLYMWHQLVFAFTRYFVVSEINAHHILPLLAIIFLLSLLSFYLVETPFRRTYSLGTVLSVVGLGLIITIGISSWIYFKGGVIKDIPELDITTSSSYRNMHLNYNSQHLNLTQPFKTEDKVKILVIGNSFARDWINVLLASKHKDKLEITYQLKVNDSPSFINKLVHADKVFFNVDEANKIDFLVANHNLNISKVWIIGIKNFGINNGLYYNNSRKDDYCQQRTPMVYFFANYNRQLFSQWRDRYIDLIGLIIDENDEVPVFTPNCKFISQDCKHLTPSGAKYFADLLTSRKKNNMETLLFK